MIPLDTALAERLDHATAELLSQQKICPPSDPLRARSIHHWLTVLDHVHRQVISVDKELFDIDANCLENIHQELAALYRVIDVWSRNMRQQEAILADPDKKGQHYRAQQSREYYARFLTRDLYQISCLQTDERQLAEKCREIELAWSLLSAYGGPR